MQEKIDEEFLNPLTAYFLPEYPVNGWPIFQGLFKSFYETLDDLCEFKALNVQECGVCKIVKDILRTLKRYLSRMGQITWSPEELKSRLEQQELRKSQKIYGKKDKEFKGQNQYTNKMKRQTETCREAPRVRPKLETQHTHQVGKLSYVTQPLQGNKEGQEKGKGQHSVAPKNSSSTQPLLCGQCQKQYKNIKSYRTHVYQVHMIKIPEGSSHSLTGKSIVRTVLLKPNPSAQTDQLMYPRQDQSPKGSWGQQN